MNRVADLVAHRLATAGIRHAFGMPGGEVVDFVDALEAAGIRFVLARNETAAAVMAAGGSAVTGAPGLLVTTLGPGLANAVNGIANASQERTPLIVVSGVVERALRGRYTHQVLDHAALLRPLVKASFEIEPEGAAAIVDRAVALAKAVPRGPVHLDLSPTVAVAADALTGHPVGQSEIISAPIDPASAAVRAVRARLAAAERPLLLAGADAANGAAGQGLTLLAHRHGIPIITTYKAKGVLDERHPCALGGAGLSPKADAILLPLLDRAGLVITAGYDPIEMRSGWIDAFKDPGRVVELTALPADHGMHAAGTRLIGPVGSLLSAIGKGLAMRPVWPGGEITRAKTALAGAFATSAAWGPHAVIETLEAVLPDGARVTVDSGAHRILLSQKMRVREPGALLQSAGFCTMGAALPLAIGAKLADPVRPIVAVMGDGGFEMTLGELGTLRDLKLPVVLLIFQDHSLALISLKQRRVGLPEIGVRLGPTDYVAIAKAFGGHGVAVSNTDDLANALGGAFRSDSFTVISAHIDANAYVDAI
ncbi:MAG: thiamine pyrophosphate-binding protein [Geminicoccaceae bacterium]